MASFFKAPQPVMEQKSVIEQIESEDTLMKRAAEEKK